MARKDVKYSRSRGGGGRSSGSDDYDDEGRGRSKLVWEDFRDSWEMKSFDCSWLFELDEMYLSELIVKTRYRYNVPDGPSYWKQEPGSYADHVNVEEQMRQDDSRVARLVKKECGEDTWYLFYLALIEGYERHQKALCKYEVERNEIWKLQREAERAGQLKLKIEETTKLRREAELVAGLLRSDFHEALKFKEVYGQRDGDWLDDPVGAYSTGYGFGEEVKERSGIKLQVTVSLDTSNSMWYNKIAEAAVETFRTVYMALEQLAKENPGDIFYEGFTFSGGDDGKYARSLSREFYGEREQTESHLGNVEEWREMKSYQFHGEDTWVYPLFQEIEKWENEKSDPGAVRLDIVITDAVLEHPTDVRRSNVIQERRDGTLQTIFLNLLPEQEWVNSTLPFKCVQYPARVDNIAGMLRNLLAEFVSVYV